jgi:hypothetical protein
VKKAKKVRKVKRPVLPSPGSRRCMIYGGLSDQEYAEDTLRRAAARELPEERHYVLGDAADIMRDIIARATPPGTAFDTTPLPFGKGTVAWVYGVPEKYL